jgi:beta-glucosidase
VPNETKAGDDFKISVEVQNTGKIAGDEVVQLYVKDMEASVPVPIRALQGFKRIHLQPGEKRTVEFTLQPKQLAIIDENAKYVVEPGVFEIAVGGLLPGTKSPTTEFISKELKIVGEKHTVN